MQAGPIHQELYVVPPKQLTLIQDSVWKLEQLSCDIVKAGRQWICTVEDELSLNFRSQQVAGIEQLFYKYGCDERDENLIAKVFDDFLIASTSQATSRFIHSIEERPKLDKVLNIPPLKFLCCDIFRNHGENIEMRMNGYRDRVRTISISCIHKLSLSNKASSAEETQSRTVAGTLLYYEQQ